MSNYRFLWVVLLSAMFIVAGCSNTGSNSVVDGENASDTVLVNGKFYTVDEESNWAEAIAIEDDIKVRVLEVKGGQVRLGVEAPKHVTVHREEIYLKILEENRKAAMEISADLSELDGFLKDGPREHPEAGDNSSNEGE